MRRVDDVMTRKMITVNPGLHLQELAAVFERKRISGCPVVDDDGVIVGVVTKTDLARARAQGDTLVDIFYRTATGVVGGDAMMDDEYNPYPNYDLTYEDFREGDLEDLCVADVMNRNIYSISADSLVSEAARSMLDKKCHRLLVTDGGHFVGIVSTTDLLRALAEAGPLFEQTNAQVGEVQAA